METTTQLDLKEMGRRIKSKREYLHMSREALAETIDVSTQFVFDIEAGHKGTTIRRLLKICQALDLSPNYLLIGKISEQDESGAKKRLQEEILELLSRCTIKQLEGARDILRIYDDNLHGIESKTENSDAR